MTTCEEILIVDRDKLEAYVSYFFDCLMDNYPMLFPIDLCNKIFPVIESITTTEYGMNINANKLRELLHELKECIGSLINSSESEIRLATDKIESVFEHDTPPVVSGETQAPVADTTPEVVPTVTSNPAEPTA